MFEMKMSKQQARQQHGSSGGVAYVCSHFQIGKASKLLQAHVEYPHLEQ